METQLRKLRLIFRLTRLTPEMFYSISFTSGEINLQGNYNSNLVRHLKGAVVAPSGFVKWKKNNIEITLT